SPSSPATHSPHALSLPALASPPPPSLFLFTHPPPPHPNPPSLHDALPISLEFHNTEGRVPRQLWTLPWANNNCPDMIEKLSKDRSEEHTSELQSRFDLVCRLLLEKKKKRREDRKPARDTAPVRADMLTILA